MNDQPKYVLDGLSTGDYDTSLTPETGDDELELPPGALLAFRSSGGMRFTSREWVLYRDGWIVVNDEAPRMRHISRANVAHLAHLALRARLARPRPRPTPPADGYIYEVVAHLGGRTYHAEFAQASIPPEAAPLLRALRAL
ncbi:protealysin inhibitor emfourin [Candidatus Oscillochloris fontis]|uniref:protealysin inhibitor emfourin n=1 Tax=Candidatus Oscillochloris fontis TaxID=2496868 RepID=UPI00101C3D26|nr:protealysin inhibitor emfourin [Candidatus Oscillochloris fontis]